MDLPVRFEVHREVLLGIPPPAGANDIDLPAADGLPQGPQHAQLVGDPLHLADLVDDRLAPLPGHHPVERDPLPGGVVPLPTWPLRVAAEQLQGVHHRPVDGVVAAELERPEQLGEHLAVVVRVRGAQHGPNSLAERALAGPAFPSQVPQRLLGDHGVDHGPHGVVGMLHRRCCHGEEDALLAPHAAQVGQQLPLHLAFRLGVDLVDQGDEQIHQTVGDLRPARPAQRRQQGQADRPRGVPQIRRVRRARPGPPSGHHLLGHVGEEILGYADRPDPLQLVDFAQKRFQPQAARVGLQFSQEAGPAAAQLRLTLGDQRLQMLDGSRRETTDRALAEPRLEASDARTNDPAQLPSRGRLDSLLPAAGQQRFPQPLPAQLDRAHLLGQPRRQAVLVGFAALPEPQRGPDLGPVILDRPPRPGVLGQRRRVHPHQAGDVVHRRLRDLVTALREPPLQLEVLEEQREPQARRPRLVRHQTGLPRPASSRRPAPPAPSPAAHSAPLPRALTAPPP